MGVGDTNRLFDYIVSQATIGTNIDSLAEEAIDEVMGAPVEDVAVEELT